MRLGRASVSPTMCGLSLGGMARGGRLVHLDFPETRRASAEAHGQAWPQSTWPFPAALVLGFATVSSGTLMKPPAVFRMSGATAGIALGIAPVSGRSAVWKTALTI
jgi:hypothetical protein